jgi:hypothetical protein
LNSLPDNEAVLSPARCVQPIPSLSKDETAPLAPLSSRPLPLRSLGEPLRSQWNLGLPSARASRRELLSMGAGVDAMGQKRRSILPRERAFGEGDFVRREVEQLIDDGVDLALGFNNFRRQAADFFGFLAQKVFPL